MSIESFDEEAIFKVARKIQPADARAEYLEQVCGHDPVMLDRICTLLHIHDHKPSFLESPISPPGATIDFPPVAERPGTQIGPYKLIQEIGEGGMGIVYMAAQKEPVRRKVALKIIKPGMDTREVISRFAAEQQALAVMDHPNIAKVFDAGTTESGRPYFVMELVNGVTLTQYCDDNHLPTHQRLELFILVCHAVQHAHQKGIIHRDIKPSNILVTLHDGVPVPKIIDFGIAKAISQPLSANTVYTSHGQMIGTPLYMSPEQAETSGLDIDTRSDIYSLGVLLYELLTGSTPFDRAEFKDAGLDEVRRLIREQEPPRPSTRISTLGKLATTVSEHRRTNPVELSNSLRHELDWIVMKALEKDRTRRYETANDFARDIQRYLDDEPVEACPPSTLYRVRKFTRRHQGAVVATTAVGLALLLGVGGVAGQAYRATKAEKYAEEQLQIAQEQERLAKQQTQLAKKQKKLVEEAAQRERDLRADAEAARQQAEKVTDFLVEIFRSPNPYRDGRTITVAEMLDKAKTRVETEFKVDRLLQGKLLGAIGETYSGLGLVQEAADLAKKSCDTFRDSLGPEHLDTLSAMNRLAEAYYSAGQLDQALSLLEETLRLRREKLGPDHPATLESLSNLAVAFGKVGRWNEALRLHEEAVKRKEEQLGAEHPDTLWAKGNLAVAYTDAGRLDESIRLGERTLPLLKTKLGPDHPDTLMRMNNLACAYLKAGRRDEALLLLDETLRLCKEKLDPKRTDALQLTNMLAAAYWKLGRLDRSIPLFEEALGLRKTVSGEDHSDTLEVMANLGVNYKDAGRIAEALPLLETAYHASTQHPSLRWVGRPLLAGYVQAGKSAEAVALMKELLTPLRKSLSPDSQELAGQLADFSLALLQVGAFADAEPLLRECLSIRDKAAPDDWRTFNTKSMLGGALLGQSKQLQASDAAAATAKCTEAESLLVQGYEGMQQREATIPPEGRIRLTEAVQRLVDFFTTLGKADDAAKWQEKLDPLQGAAKPEGSEK